MTGRTFTSSPLSSARSTPITFQTASSESSSHYRSARPLPRELLQQVNIYLEECLFSQALRVLLSLVSASSANDKRPILLPPPDYLGVLNTLSIHPDLTSRASTQEKLKQSNLARQYLRTINGLVGPVNASLIEAYRFRKFDHVHVEEQSNGEAITQTLGIKYADSQSVFTSKDDFWSVIGWAFNCSCLPGPYATRWLYWSSWLQHMLEVLESDWQCREELGKCQESLIWKYISSAIGGFARARRTIRAIFADGSRDSLNFFTEVFRKELKGPRIEHEKAKKQEVAVKVDEDIYGDWLQDSESSIDEDVDVHHGDVANRPSKRLRTRTPLTRRRRLPQASKSPIFTEEEDTDASGQEESGTRHGLGPLDSIMLRLRLLQLLSNVSAHPTLRDSEAADYWPDLHELYTLFVEFVQDLPLSSFQQIILPSFTSGLIPDARMLLCEFVLQRVADTDRTNRGRTTLEAMTQVRLVRDYLPYAATKGRNPVEHQAKMSLLLESILRQLAKETSSFRPTTNLINATIIGIRGREARAAKARSSNRNKKTTISKGEEMADRILHESSARIQFVVNKPYPHEASH
ncbi:hypothetical protein LTS08_004872 [Lithohypha guttulata]|uniref:Uncharacterized protein n=1 Tax=Lithohypha guttulata TaxID=1690604 RepID=A0AAN7T3Y7_9EURO|nr:hypothetical protein LTR05_002284 [Lithohypha guttulata]KAK5101265.1 hypothetical protein LTS08_004872 [Lithohypha guttulata]